MSQYVSDFPRGSERDDERSGKAGASMTDYSPTAIPRPVQVTTVPTAQLEPDAIGVAQDTIIGLASSGPAATIAVTLASLAAAAAYGSGPVIILCGIPMLMQGTNNEDIAPGIDEHMIRHHTQWLPSRPSIFRA